MENYSEEWEEEVREKSDALVGAVENLDSMLPSVSCEEGEELAEHVENTIDHVEDALGEVKDALRDLRDVLDEPY